MLSAEEIFNVLVPMYLGYNNGKDESQIGLKSITPRDEMTVMICEVDLIFWVLLECVVPGNAEEVNVC